MAVDDHLAAVVKLQLQHIALQQAFHLGTGGVQRRLDALKQGIALFCAQSMVMPGIPVAGFVSSGPGMLQPVPLASTLEGIANGLLSQNGIRGEAAPDLAKALAQGVDLGLTMFAGQVMVSPRIPCPPGASAGPGRLM